jgi:glycerol-3-phosphate acyltransferase PlsY
MIGPTAEVENLALPMIAALTIAGSFLLGSIPFGLLISKYVFRVDLRQHGSGNIGAANALRTIGRGGAIATLLLDVGKGYLPVLLNSYLFSPFILMLIGAAATLGHCFSPWLRFRGGKGVATLLGTVLALSPLTALGCVIIYLICLRVTRVSAARSPRSA